jgi:hypothetical protein
VATLLDVVVGGDDVALEHAARMIKHAARKRRISYSSELHAAFVSLELYSTSKVADLNALY